MLDVSIVYELNVYIVYALDAYGAYIQHINCAYLMQTFHTINVYVAHIECTHCICSTYTPYNVDGYFVDLSGCLTLLQSRAKLYGKAIMTASLYFHITGREVVLCQEVRNLSTALQRSLNMLMLNLVMNSLLHSS